MKQILLLLILLLGCRGESPPLESDDRLSTTQTSDQTTQTVESTSETTTPTGECVAKQYEYHRFKMTGGLGFLTLDLRIPKGSLELCELEKIQACTKIKTDNSDATLRFNYMAYKRIRNDNVIKTYESSKMIADFIQDIAGEHSRLHIGCAKTVGLLYVAFQDTITPSMRYDFRSENYADFRAGESVKGEQLKHDAADTCFSD